MLRLVVDTSVLVSALRSRSGASARVIGLVLERRVVALASSALLLEYEDVLTRTDHLAAVGITRDDLEVLLATLAALLEPVTLDFRWRPQLSDPADEFVLDIAVNGRAHAIVTHNVRDFAAAARFGIRVVTPSDLLRSLTP